MRGRTMRLYRITGSLSLIRTPRGAPEAGTRPASGGGAHKV